MFHLWFCLILLDVKINLYQCQCQYFNFSYVVCQLSWRFLGVFGIVIVFYILQLGVVINMPSQYNDIFCSAFKNIKDT